MKALSDVVSLAQLVVLTHLAVCQKRYKVIQNTDTSDKKKMPLRGIVCNMILINYALVSSKIHQQLGKSAKSKQKIERGKKTLVSLFSFCRNKSETLSLGN